MAAIPPKQTPSERKLRIVHVLRAPLGGLFRHVIDLSKEQIARRHAVGLVTDSLTGGARAAAILAELEPSLSLGLLRLPMPRQPHLLDISAAAQIALHIRALGVVSVGRMSTEKEPEIFAEAARLAGQRAIFIGDGPQAVGLKARYPEALILGWNEAAEVRTLLRQARALVFPSVWSLTVLEALALGSPVIVGDQCAGRESVQNGVSGLWFRSNDAASLAAAIRELSIDETARRMSRAAYDRFWTNPPTLERHLDGLAGVYDAALGVGSKVFERA
jgi:hypothetical protein